MQLRCPSCEYSAEFRYGSNDDEAPSDWRLAQLEILEKEHPYHPKD